MKKINALVLVLVSIIIFAAGCLKPSTYQTTEIQNVSINIFDVTSTDATVIIKASNPSPYVYGEWYEIEREKDGTWYEVKTIISNYGFNEIGYIPNNNGEVEFKINWEWLYGELPEGNYRLLKQVNTQYIFVEFCVEK